MPSVDIIDLSNKKVGTLDLSDAVFGAPVNEALLYEAVRHHLAGTRRGTAKTKTRHEVAGSGKKLWKQKGTGARAWVRSAVLCGGMAAPRTVRNRATILISCPGKCN